MKNQISKISPYVVLLIPVVFFSCISLGIKQQIASPQPLHYGVCSQAQIIIKQCPNRFIQ
jgi:hypothetical protein